MVMAGREDRECDQNQRGNQAASPPTILFQYLLLNTVETRFEALLRCFLLISGASCFLRHERLPLFFIPWSYKRTISQPAYLQQNQGRALIMLHQRQRRSAAAEVTCGESESRGGRISRPPARLAGQDHIGDFVLAELGKFDGAAVVFSRRSRVRDLGSMLKLVRMAFRTALLVLNITKLRILPVALASRPM